MLHPYIAGVSETFIFLRCPENDEDEIAKLLTLLRRPGLKMCWIKSCPILDGKGAWRLLRKELDVVSRILAEHFVINDAACQTTGALPPGWETLNCLDCGTHCLAVCPKCHREWQVENSCYKTCSIDDSGAEGGLLVRRHRIRQRE
jgi:hypothetical protein